MVARNAENACSATRIASRIARISVSSFFDRSFSTKPDRPTRFAFVENGDVAHLACVEDRAHWPPRPLEHQRPPQNIEATVGVLGSDGTNRVHR